jgi:hypothetical protein
VLLARRFGRGQRFSQPRAGSRIGSKTADPSVGFAISPDDRYVLVPAAPRTDAMKERGLRSSWDPGRWRLGLSTATRERVRHRLTRGG